MTIHTFVVAMVSLGTPFLGLSAMASVWTVGPDAKIYDFTEIQPAVDASVDGDTIELYGVEAVGSDYTEAVVINTLQVAIQAAAGEDVEWSGGPHAALSLVDGVGQKVFVNDITFDADGAGPPGRGGGGGLAIGGGIYVEGDVFLVVDGCTFEQGISTATYGVGIGVVSSNFGPEIQIDNCSFWYLDATSTLLGAVARGAAIWQESGSLTVMDSLFQSCTAGYGGAIHLSDVGANIQRCEFMDNAADNRGGAIYLTNSTAVLSECWAMLNEASGLFAKGGAIAGSNSDISLTHCSFDFNRVTIEQGGGPLVNSGGASYYGGGAVWAGNGDSFSVNTCEFHGNEVVGVAEGNYVFGGALLATAEAFEIQNSTFSANRLLNTTSVGGGACFVRTDTSGGHLNAGSDIPWTTTLDGCTFVGNQSSVGGGLALLEGLGKTDWHFASMSGCTFAGNSAMGSLYDFGNLDDYGILEGPGGGGLYINGSSTIASIMTSTFDDNVAYKSGGGIFGSAGTGGLLSLANCSFTNNVCLGDSPLEGNGGGAALIVNEPTIRSGGFETFAAVTHCTFASNMSAVGGGLMVTTRDGHPIDIGSSTFQYNRARFVGGGIAMLVENADVLPTTISLNRCDVLGNTSDLFGGGCFIYSDTDQRLVSGGLPMGFEASRCTINGNISDNGGGFYLWNADPTIVNCQILGNTSPIGGGLSSLEENLILSTVIGNTFCGNGDDPWGNIDSTSILPFNDTSDDCVGACDGDLNADGTIDILDNLLWLKYDSADNPAGDLTGGGWIDRGDLIFLLAYFGTNC